MLNANEVIDLATRLWRLYLDELPGHDEVRAFMHGKRGIPVVPAGSTPEMHEIAALSVKNIMPMVVDAFVQNMSCVGFRSPSAQTDAEVWSIWQRERLDARQAEINRPTIAYGAAYMLHVLEDGETRFLPRSPRQMVAIYDDPANDLWPIAALDLWADSTVARGGFRGTLYDGTHQYPVAVRGKSKTSLVIADEEAEPGEHGFDVCPVVRFVNDRDPEDLVRGEVEPLIPAQRAINAVNFDRLVVSRFGAFPQKYVMGWSPASSGELANVGVSRLMAFENPETKAGTFAAANVTAYNEILGEMIAHVAVQARVPVFALTGDISNVGAETIALIDAPNQRKVKAKRESLGESWEQSMRLAARAEGVEVPEDAEVIWADSEARSFAQVVDGMVKLASVPADAGGIPLVELLDFVPGMTQQRIDAIRQSLTRSQGQAVLNAAAALAASAPPLAGDPIEVAGGGADVYASQTALDEANILKAKADALGVLRRAGVEAESAARLAGLDGVEFIPGSPITIKAPEPSE